MVRNISKSDKDYNFAHPMVSVCMITYNHERFIAQAIEGILIQQADFLFEIVIGEDCSTDGTRAIVKAYAEKYPKRIRATFNKNNLGAHANFITTLQACEGNYIALCEGDDYWTDPYKLQKQVVLLECNPNYSMSFHKAYELDQPSGKLTFLRPNNQTIKKSYNLCDVIKEDFIPTASIMFRKNLINELPSWYYDCQVGDWPLIIICAKKGDIGFINQVMSVYRVHPDGVFSGGSVDMMNKMVTKTIEVIRPHLDVEYQNQLHYSLAYHYLKMSSISMNRKNRIDSKKYFLKSISESHLRFKGLYLDSLVLFLKIFMPFIYSALKRLQASIIMSSTSKSSQN